MPLQILVVGPSLHDSKAILSRAERCGCQCHVVDTFGEARSLLATIQFDLVFVKEYLPDGSGYDLMPAIEEMAGSLYVAIALSDSCLWLPAVEEGMRCLGDTALNSGVFLGIFEEILRLNGGAAQKEKPNEIPGSHASTLPYSGARQHSLGTRRTGRSDRMPARGV